MKKVFSVSWLLIVLTLAVPVAWSANVFGTDLDGAPTDCSDFNVDEEGWTHVNAAVGHTNAPITSDGTHYLTGSDNNGGSFIYNDDHDRDWVGDISCSTICFDYKVIQDGWPTSVTTLNVIPNITVFSGSDPSVASLRATFFADDTVTEQDSFRRYCTTIRPDELPEGWVMNVGSDDQWGELLANASGIAFTTDVAIDDPSTTFNESGTINEVIGVDNVCITTFRDEGVAAFHFQNMEGDTLNRFCVNEDVYLNGIASENDDEYFIELFKRPFGNTNAPFVFIADQNTGEWEDGPVDVVNLTQLFLDDPDGSIVFSPDCEYQVRLTIRNSSSCVLEETTGEFTIRGLPVPEFHFEDGEGNITDEFCAGEEILLNGIDSENEWWHFIAIIEVSPTGEEDYLFETGKIWELADITNLTNLMEDNNYAFQEGYTYIVKLVVGNNCAEWVEEYRELTIVSLENPYFPSADICRVNDEYEITVTASNEHVNHQWLIYLLDNGAPCQSYPTPPTPDINSGNMGAEQTFTFTVPYNPGQCITIIHGTWSGACQDWRPFDRSFPLPEIPEANAEYQVLLQPFAGSQNWYLANYDALENDFPVTHEWSIEEGPTSTGPWEPHSPASGMQGSSPTSLQRYGLFYRMCHRVQSDVPDICTAADFCRIVQWINPDEEEFYIFDEFGVYIGRGMPGDEIAGSGPDGGEGGESGGRNLIGGVNEFSLSPNPAHDLVQYRWSTEEVTPGERYQLQVMDATGRLILDLPQDAEQGGGQLEVSDLKSGVYFVRLIRNREIMTTERLIIQ